jgi:serine/threonine protein kinase
LNPNKLEDCYDLDDEVLGVGVGGVVRIGYSKETKQKFAIKIIKKKSFSKVCEIAISLINYQEILATFKRELGILAKLENHQHIVTMYEYFEDDKGFALVLEL